jgi:hypothetical protein
MRLRLRSSVLILFLIPVLASAKDYRAERYHVQLRLDKPGDLDVTETAVFRFEGGPFTYVFRNISANETDGIENVRAWMDGRLCPPGTGPGEVEITPGSPTRVRWHFEPVSDRTHTFVVSYRARGTIRKLDAGDTLIWRALPPDRKYRIGESEITLEYPPGVQLAELSVRGRRKEIEVEPQRATAQLTDVKRDTKVTLTARFPSGSFESGVPRWQALRDQHRGEFASGLRTGALVAVSLIALAVLGLVRLRGSDSEPVPRSRVVSDLPDSLGPAKAAALAGSSHGAAGVLMDLARRGVIRIEEIEKRRFGSRDFRVVRVPSVQKLEPHEQEFLKVLFSEGEGESLMSKAASRIQSKWGRVSSEVKRELELMGFVDDVKRQHRRALLVTGTLSSLAGAGLLVLWIANNNSPEAFTFGMIAAAGGAALLTGIVALVLGAGLEPWSLPGRMAAAQWKGFRSHLKELSRGRAPLPGPDALDRFLPYAAAFGLARAFVKNQQKSGGFALPAWFAAFDSGDGSSVAAFVAFTAATDSSSGASSGSGSGGSGGGSSGAG